MAPEDGEAHALACYVHGRGSGAEVPGRWSAPQKSLACSAPPLAPPGGTGTSETGRPRSEACSTRGKGSPGQYLCGAVAAPGPRAVLWGVCSMTQDLHTHVSPCCSPAPVASRAGCGGRSTEGRSGGAGRLFCRSPTNPTLASAGRGFSNLKSTQLFQIESQV